MVISRHPHPGPLPKGEGVLFVAGRYFDDDLSFRGFAGHHRINEGTWIGELHAGEMAQAIQAIALICIAFILLGWIAGIRTGRGVPVA